MDQGDASNSLSDFLLLLFSDIFLLRKRKATAEEAIESSGLSAWVPGASVAGVAADAALL